jgi:hypothetical protein
VKAGNKKLRMRPADHFALDEREILGMTHHDQSWRPFGNLLLLLLALMRKDGASYRSLFLAQNGGCGKS